MSLKGQALLFAEAILAHYPNLEAAKAVSNKNYAIIAGASEKTAANAGSRLAGREDVRAYIKARWAEYYADEDAQNAQKTVVVVQEGLDLVKDCDFKAFKAWFNALERDSDDFKNAVMLMIGRLGATTDPMELCQSVMINPFAKDSDKLKAAAEINKYTRAKPVQMTEKEREIKAMQEMAQGGLDFGDDDNNNKAHQAFNGMMRFDFSEIVN